MDTDSQINALRKLNGMGFRVAFNDKFLDLDRVVKALGTYDANVGEYEDETVVEVLVTENCFK